MSDRLNFLYPRCRYHGHKKPEYLDFNANLQEFAQRVTTICNLQTSGKLPPEQAYDQIQDLWQQLHYSGQHLLDID
ncbi:hypothetical protein MC7420_7412 [Coleofasciculus chthonoplastes PCC 7420]|uniref:Uncharacterized protein n=1 Tax=Coleofasciculus chthonoplastes PCC 7420 TaxID=118168 RepID=B4VI10_9CYAN|nr:hypothetical protein [Coleofasciculus chthonoplastes]EDX78759.1 hypothetical protein MC7420_7412 [Coleofasciculus chthonoplastes PCC 7420]